MGKMARDKGARGEREIIDILQPIVDTAYKGTNCAPPQLKRTSSMQADGGGCDVHGLPWLALEVKRCETLHVEAWWRQCLSQTKPDQLPALCYRQNHGQWRVHTWVQAAIGVVPVPLTVDIAMPDFLTYFGALVRWYLQQQEPAL